LPAAVEDNPGVPGTVSTLLVFAVVGLVVVLIAVGVIAAGGAGPDGDLPPGTPWGIRLTQYLLGLGITGALATVASWIAFGLGPRTFNILARSLPFG